MNKPVYIITTHGQESSKALAEGLVGAGINAHWIDARREHVDNLTGIVFSYGTSIPTRLARKRYNRSSAVKTCVDKLSTFRALEKAGIPTCTWTLDRRVAKEWQFAICREDRSNRRNEGMTHWYGPEYGGKDEEPPKAELYVQWFQHVREYRVVVFLDQVFIYFKSEKREKGTWDLNFRPTSGPWLTAMSEYALKAAKAIGIDYVGFDVLMASNGELCFTEGNSSPILCDEVKAAIINHFKAQ